MGIEHIRRESGTETYCNCGAAQRMTAWMEKVGHEAVLRMEGSGNRFHSEGCALLQSPDGRPYTVAELDAARIIELHIMANDGGLVDFREVARELINSDVLDDPADVLMRAADRLWALLGWMRGPLASLFMQTVLKDPGHHRHECVIEHNDGHVDYAEHKCACGITWTT